MDIWAGPMAHWLSGMEWRIALAHPAESAMVVHMTRGQGRAVMRGVRHGLGANTVLYIPKGAVFSIEFGRQSHARLMTIAETDIAFPKQSCLLRLRDVTSIGEFSVVLDAAMHEAETPRALQHEAMHGHAQLMNVWLKRSIAGDEAISLPADSMARLSERFFERLGAPRPGKFELEEHAEALGVSAAHLARACKSATGKTAAVLLREVTLHAALQLTTGTDVAFQDIARHLGYGSAGYFTRAVQAATGKSPSAHRQAAARQSLPAA